MMMYFYHHDIGAELPHNDELSHVYRTLAVVGNITAINPKTVTFSGLSTIVVSIPVVTILLRSCEIIW